MKGNSPRSPDDGPSTAKCAINTVRAKLGSQPREILIEEGKSSFSSVDFLPSSNGPPLVRDTLAISREISTVANRIETNPASSFLPIRSNDTERVLSGDPSHRPRERRPQWRAMAINYNIMVSLLTFLCSWLTRPGLTPKSLRIALLSLENTTEQGRQCQKERERERERKRERERDGRSSSDVQRTTTTWCSAPGTYLRSRGRSESNNASRSARNCPSASALIECLFLSAHGDPGNAARLTQGGPRRVREGRNSGGRGRGGRRGGPRQPTGRQTDRQICAGHSGGIFRKARGERGSDGGGWG